MGLITKWELPENCLHRPFSNLNSTLHALTEKHVVMLVFLRDFQCLFCREALFDLRRQRAELEKRNTVLALAHLHAEEDVSDYLHRLHLGDVPRISDPGQELFHAFGLYEATLSQLFGASPVVRALSIRFRRLPTPPKLPRTSIRQMPGVFLLKTGKVIGGFVHDRISDRPDYLGLSGFPESNPPLRF